MSNRNDFFKTATQIEVTDLVWSLHRAMWLPYVIALLSLQTANILLIPVIKIFLGDETCRVNLMGAITNILILLLVVFFNINSQKILKKARKKSHEINKMVEVLASDADYEEKMAKFCEIKGLRTNYKKSYDRDLEFLKLGWESYKGAEVRTGFYDVDNVEYKVGDVVENQLAKDLWLVEPNPEYDPKDELSAPYYFSYFGNMEATALDIDEVKNFKIVCTAHSEDYDRYLALFTKMYWKVKNEEDVEAHNKEA